MSASSCTAGPSGDGTVQDLRKVDAAAEVRKLYQRNFGFVWRNLRRLGVASAQLDDAAQDVFVVAHRRWRDFDHRANERTWLFAILLRVAGDYRKASRRRERWFSREEADVEAAEDPSGDLHLAIATREATLHVQRLLDVLDFDKRAILVLVDLEEMTVPEAAEALGLGVNAAYGRLRRAREAFKAAYSREQAAELRRMR
jgi:RNA polymerase sigma-70 factor (ECF subfamily)